MASKWAHASAELVASLLRAMDGSVLRHDRISVAPYSFTEHGLSPAQNFRGLQQYAYWMVGEYIFLWLDKECLRNAFCFEFVAYCGERTAVVEIVTRLVRAMWIDQGDLQLRSLESLYKVAAAAVKLSDEELGVVSYIRHEICAFLAAAVGVDEKEKGCLTSAVRYD